MRTNSKKRKVFFYILNEIWEIVELEQEIDQKIKKLENLSKNLK